MKPLMRQAFAVHLKILTLAVVPIAAVSFGAGCSHHKRSALRPVYVAPAPVVTESATPCPAGEPCPAGASSGLQSARRAVQPDARAGPDGSAEVRLGRPAIRWRGAEPPAQQPGRHRTAPAPERPDRPPRDEPAASRRFFRRGDTNRERVTLFIDESNDLFLPPKADRIWKYIVLHHSDHATGSYAQIDRDHREKLGTQGCGYHFVIGNGSESKDGRIEVAGRWLDQKAGAHCRDATTPDANDYGIGICLIGDFDENPPTAGQIEATKALVAYLRERYNIPADRVVSHSAIAQSATSCPGSKFPIDAVVNGRGFAAH